jgi:hypothetical protein
MKFPVDLCASPVDLCESLMARLHGDPLRFHGVPQKFVLTLLVFCLSVKLPAQDQFQSIHFEQVEFYEQFGEKPAVFYDSLDGFSGSNRSDLKSDCQLHKIVFGYHPYWSGSKYLNYQWNLVSDLCYFSYEVDAATGDPLTVHEWHSDPAPYSAWPSRQSTGTALSKSSP